MFVNSEYEWFEIADLFCWVIPPGPKRNNAFRKWGRTRAFPCSFDFSLPPKFPTRAGKSDVTVHVFPRFQQTTNLLSDFLILKFSLIWKLFCAEPRLIRWCPASSGTACKYTLPANIRWFALKEWRSNNFTKFNSTVDIFRIGFFKPKYLTVW